MITEQLLINKWQNLDPDEQTKVLAFIDSMSSKTKQEQSENTYQPKTKLGQKLWGLRQKSLGKQPLLTTWEEIERELAQRRGGIQK